MKLPQVQTFIGVTDGEWSLGDYEKDMTNMINEFILVNQISPDDLIDIKMSTCVNSNEDDCAYGVYCTALLIYNKEIEE